MPDDDFTVLILNSLKKVRSIKVNRFRIRLAMVGAATFVVILMLSIGANYYLFMQNRSISHQLAARADEDLVTDQPVAAEEENGFNTTGDSPDAPPTDPSADREQPLPGERKTVPEKPEETVDIFAGDKTLGLVGIEDLESTLELNKIELNVSFTITNKLGTGEPVAGFIVVVGKTTDKTMSYVSWPVMKLDGNGKPVEYAKGERFTIKYLRPISARMLLNDPAEKFEFYRILVYSLDGELLAQKSYALDS